MSAGRSSASPGAPDPWWIEAYERLWPLWSRAWPGVLLGQENIPAHDDFILIANHSGLGVAECVTLPGVWIREMGQGRPLAAMAHGSLFRLPGMGHALRGLGAIEASREGAAWARSRRTPLILFPGGDHEAMRPIWRADEVDFNGRTGFVRLAREHGLTIVPLAIRNSHVTLPNLAGGKALAWLTGARIIGLHRAPLPVLSLIAAPLVFRALRGRGLGTRALSAWLAFWAAALVPWVPSEIEYEVLPPIDDLDAPDDQIGDAVVSAIQKAVRTPSRQRAHATSSETSGDLPADRSYFASRRGEDR